MMIIMMIMIMPTMIIMPIIKTKLQRKAKGGKRPA